MSLTTAMFTTSIGMNGQRKWGSIFGKVKSKVVVGRICREGREVAVVGIELYYL